MSNGISYSHSSGRSENFFFFGAIACLKPRVTIEAESSSDEPGLRARRPHKVISETEDYAKVLKPYREAENLNAIA